MFVGLWTAIAAGFIVGKITRDANPVKDTSREHKHEGGCSCSGHDTTDNHEHTCSCNSHEQKPDESACSCGHDHHTYAPSSVSVVEPSCACGHEHIHDAYHHDSTSKSSLWNKFTLNAGKFLDHTTQEFIDSAALIIIGAFFSAIIQIMIPRTMMYPVASSPVGSVGVMMAFTWVISLCANADAFVAKSFYGLFTTGSVVAFMTFGQMIDLKNTIVMLGFFRKRFVVITISVIAFLCLACGIAINFAGSGA